MGIDVGMGVGEGIPGEGGVVRGPGRRDGEAGVEGRGWGGGARGEVAGGEEGGAVVWLGGAGLGKEPRAEL